jgi:hypothetical protein
MTDLALFIGMPDDWTDAQAELLGERLAVSELPPGVTLVLVTPSPDGEAFSGAVREWAVT